uniref:Uncharacterized protein n=1 Tax=Oryza sativa subsp. japonica TaxID=39947 RepID=Q6K3A3_ORYSJ|nr:hypothetical protein [Oryza sativa Japonica Group]
MSSRRVDVPPVPGSSLGLAVVTARGGLCVARLGDWIDLAGVVLARPNLAGWFEHGRLG